VNDATDLPDDIDPELWFECRHHPGQRDYLYNARWHTFPGRMGAYCPTRKVSFRVSIAEMPSDLPLATRYWVQGFLTGNMPRQPTDEEGPELVAWREKADHFFATGYWPADD
jgi:hypothetical protein